MVGMPKALADEIKAKTLTTCWQGMKIPGGVLFGVARKKHRKIAFAATVDPTSGCSRIEEVSMHKIEISPAVMDRVKAWRGRTHMFGHLDPARTPHIIVDL